MQTTTGAELLSKLDREWTVRCRGRNFLGIVNFLFQLAGSSDKLAIEDVQKGAPP
jgi:hypothetical protein